MTCYLAKDPESAFVHEGQMHYQGIWLPPVTLPLPIRQAYVELGVVKLPNRGKGTQ